MPYRAQLAAVVAANDLLMIRYYGPRLREDPVHPTVEGYADLASRVFNRLEVNRLLQTAHR